MAPAVQMRSSRDAKPRAAFERWIAHPLALRLLLGLVTAVAVGAMAWVFFAAIDHEDATGRRREEQLVSNGLRLRESEIFAALRTETIWDDAVANLDVSWNPAWAQANMVEFFTETSKFELIYVVAPDGSVKLAHAPPAAAPSQAELRPVFDELTARMRRMERRRGAFPAGPPSPRLVSTPIEAGTTAWIRGRLYVFAASLVQPDFGNARPSLEAPVVIVGDEIDKSLLAKIADYYLLDGVRLVRAAHPPAEAATTRILDGAGRTVAYIEWRPRTPAIDLMRRLITPVGAFILLLGVVGAILGVRERRQRRALEDARRRAEAASETKSAFLANMSHEIRTPLNGVLGMAQLLARTELNREQRRNVEVIIESGRALTTVLNDVLDLSKVEAGRMEVEIRPFDLGECVKAACRPFEGLATGKDLGLVVSVEEAAQGFWLGDGNRLRQIVSNLVGNAVKFTARGRVDVRVSVQPGGVAVEVADTGMGIPAERLEALFDEYAQLDASTTRRFGGTGLGLAISRRLAELMGGKLTVASTPDHGSTFRVFAPLERGSAADRPLERAPDAAAKGLVAPRILAAEDNATNRLVLSALLEPMAADLTFAINGAEAVTAYEQGAFDLVLMDVQMPVEDGVSATRRIRALEQAQGRARTPILALSANVMVDQLREYQEAGMDGHVAKPIDLQHLVEAMEQALAPPRDEPGADQPSSPAGAA